MVMDTKQRDKVLYGLQCHSTDAGVPNICGVMECPYAQYRSWCDHELTQDALNLLHDLIPQKLTLSEVTTVINRPVWLIRNTCDEKRECWALVQDDRQGNSHLVSFATAWGIERLHATAYGIGWECWTGEPSEIDRKAGCVLKGENKDERHEIST